MKAHEIVFDVETKKSFDEVGRQNFADLGVSVLGAYFYDSDSYRTFEEHELGEFEELAQGASRIIGYNIKHFDYPVLQPYMKVLQLKAMPTLDLMEEVWRVLGFRPKLNDLAGATLGVAKSGHGLQALQWFREGKMDEIKKYCLDDVRITKDLYEHGARHGHLKLEFGKERAKQPFTVQWKKLVAEPIVQGSIFG